MRNRKKNNQNIFETENSFLASVFQIVKNLTKKKMPPTTTTIQFFPFPVAKAER